MKNEETLWILIALILFWFIGGQKRNNNKNAFIQTNPANRNTNVGTGSAANTPNNWLNQGTQVVNAGVGLISGVVKAVAGLGQGSTPGKTVGVQTNETPPTDTGTGNPSFDNQDYIETISGSTQGEYYDQFLT